jgi:hypothetical protein
MSTPAEWSPCPGVGTPGVGVRDKYENMRCSFCGRLATVTKAGLMRRHATLEWYRRNVPTVQS